MRRFCGLLVIVLLSRAALSAVPAEPALTSPPAEKDGLQITIVGDQTHFARNEPIKFAVRFKNVSDKPLALQDADEFDRWVVRLEEVTSKMPWMLEVLPSDQPPLSHHARELKPGETVEVTTEFGSNRFPVRYQSELILNMPIPPTDALRAGRYKIWLGINIKRSPEPPNPMLAFRGDINAGPVEVEISDQDDPKGMTATEAVTEGGAEFQTVTRSRWQIPAVGAASEVQIGLRVTNRSPLWMQLNKFDTLQVVLEDSQGKELQVATTRDKTSIPPPLLLEARESRTIYRNATLDWSPDGKHVRLSGPDGTGGTWSVENLRPGKYKLHLVFESNKEKLQPVLEWPAKHPIDPKDAPFWMGRVTTKPFAIELLAAPGAEP